MVHILATYSIQELKHRSRFFFNVMYECGKAQLSFGLGIGLIVVINKIINDKKEKSLLFLCFLRC